MEKVFKTIWHPVTEKPNNETSIFLYDIRNKIVNVVSYIDDNWYTKIMGLEIKLDIPINSPSLIWSYTPDHSLLSEENEVPDHHLLSKKNEVEKEIHPTFNLLKYVIDQTGSKIKYGSKYEDNSNILGRIIKGLSLKNRIKLLYSNSDPKVLELQRWWYAYLHGSLSKDLAFSVKVAFRREYSDYKKLLELKKVFEPSETSDDEDEEDEDEKPSTPQRYRKIVEEDEDYS